MALFIRPTAWSYDIELFRKATGDEDLMEELLAAVALPNQGIWVVESDQKPVGFVWFEIRNDMLHIRQLYIDTTPQPSVIHMILLDQIQQEAADRNVTISQSSIDMQIRNVGVD